MAAEGRALAVAKPVHAIDYGTFNNSFAGAEQHAVRNPVWVDTLRRRHGVGRYSCG